MTEHAAPFAPDHSSTDAAAARIVRRVLKQWWLIALCGAVACIAAFIASTTRPDQYEATTRIEVGTIDLISIFLAQDVQIGDTDPDRATAAAVELFNLPNVRDRAVRALREQGVDVTADFISSAIKVTARPDTSVIAIASRSTDPKQAQQISNAMTEAFVAQRQDTARKKLISAKSQVRAQYD
ncbi:MAG: hypothetical protein JHD16_14045, partial [Solirubrobacteraceae bacterium]|nr:hypothetical protein [Solirubrobacteraceae bacterium]